MHELEAETEKKATQEVTATEVTRAEKSIGEMSQVCNLISGINTILCDVLELERMCLKNKIMIKFFENQLISKPGI